MNNYRPCGCSRPAPTPCSSGAVRNEQLQAECSCGCNTGAVLPERPCGCTGTVLPECSCGCNTGDAMPENAFCGVGIPCFTKPCCVDGMPLGMSYVPMQKWENVSNACEGLKSGTIFRDLALPFHCTGCNRGRRCYRA